MNINALKNKMLDFAKAWVLKYPEFTFKEDTREKGKIPMYVFYKEGEFAFDCTIIEAYDNTPVIEAWDWSKYGDVIRLRECESIFQLIENIEDNFDIF